MQAPQQPQIPTVDARVLNTNAPPEKCPSHLTMVLWIGVGLLTIYWVYKTLLKPRYSYTRLEQQTVATEVDNEELMELFNKGDQCLFVYASWCGHCSACKDDYDAVAAELEGVHVVKYNGGEDNSQAGIQFLAKKGLQIQGFPFFVCLRDGKVKNQQTGAFPRDAEGSMQSSMRKFVEEAFAQ
jgi:thiol-disulfide isomerase/thioredoxin